MTRKLEELFDMLPSEEEPTVKEQAQEDKTIQDIASLPADILDKVDAALPQVTGLAEDTSLDELVQLAINAHKDLFALGMQVEAAFAGRIFSAATEVLKHAMDAQQYKADKKLRMVDLQIKKQRLDLQRQLLDGKTPNINGNAVAVDRNEMLRQLSATNREKS